MSITISGNKLILPAGTGTGVFYGKAKSETWTAGVYSGTGAADNKIVTKDVYGNAMKPARVIFKRIDGVGGWVVYDNKRPLGGVNIAKNLYLDSAAVEYSDTNVSMVFDVDGFTVGTNNAWWNALNGQYLYMVEADTNASSTPDGSYFDYATTGSNLNITNGIFNYTDGKDVNGFKLTSESVTGNIDFTSVADGMKWVARDKANGSYSFYDKEPMNSIYTKNTPDDNRLVQVDGKRYITTGGELVTNGTFDVDTSGWTNGGAHTLSVESGRLKCVAVSASGEHTYQPINTEIGKEYKYSARVSTSNGYAYGIKIRRSDNSTNIIDDTIVGIGDTLFSGVFVAMDTITYINILTNSSAIGNTYYADDISVFKAQPTLLSTPIAPVSFLKNPVMVTSNTPQYIDYNQELIENVMDSLEVSKDLVVKGKLSGMSGFDLGQTWQDVTASRAKDVTYTNNTGKPIMVIVSFIADNIDNWCKFMINGIPITYSAQQTIAGKYSGSFEVIVQNGSTYRAASSSGTFTVVLWSELR